MGTIFLSIVLAFLAASLSDWLFMGVLFHDRYGTFPEIWRSPENERTKILIAQLGSAMTAIGFVWLAAYMGPFRLVTALALAVLIWLMAPLPLLLGNHLFIKLDPLVTLTHALGWLAKLLLVAAITAMIH